LRSLILLLSNAVVVILFLDLLFNAMRGPFSWLDIFMLILWSAVAFVFLNEFLSFMFRKGKRKA
jgi:hypothetical protein